MNHEVASSYQTCWNNVIDNTCIRIHARIFFNNVIQNACTFTWNAHTHLETNVTKFAHSSYMGRCHTNPRICMHVIWIRTLTYYANTLLIRLSECAHQGGIICLALYIEIISINSWYSYSRYDRDNRRRWVTYSYWRSNGKDNIGIVGNNFCCHTRIRGKHRFDDLGIFGSNCCRLIRISGKHWFDDFGIFTNTWSSDLGTSRNPSSCDLRILWNHPNSDSRISEDRNSRDLRSTGNNTNCNCSGLRNRKNHATGIAGKYNIT